MARIRKLERIVAAHSSHPTEVDATWSEVLTSEGPLLQLSTYGSDARASRPKVSQTVQIDYAIATELRFALNKVFGEDPAVVRAHR